MSSIKKALWHSSRITIILVTSLFFQGCITEGIYEQNYLKTAADKSLLLKKGDNDEYTFDLKDFYKSNRKSIIASDADATVNINYVDSGDVTKPAVLFVHGTPGSWSNFWKYMIISDLINNAHLVSVDRPGWGESSCTTPKGKYCFYPLIKKQSKYLQPLIKKLNQQNNHQGVILVGWSFGGPLIGQMAHDYSEDVKALIFIASPFDPDLSHPRWYNWLSQIFAWFVPQDIENANDEMMPLSKELAQMKSIWKSIQVPVWVIQGSIDNLVDRRNLDYSRTLFIGQKSKFIEVKTSGHFVMWEKQSVVVKSIKEALKE